MNFAAFKIDYYYYYDAVVYEPSKTLFAYRREREKERENERFLQE